MNTDDYAIFSYKLNLELLEKFPVWGAFDDDDSEVIRPVSSIDPFSYDCDPLTIKARFITPGSSTLDGCVVYDRAFGRVYLIEVFVYGNCLGFNSQLKDLVAKELAKLRGLLNTVEDPVFPIRYETDIFAEDGKKIEGTFSPL